MGRYVIRVLGFQAEGRFQRERECWNWLQVTLHALGKKISCDRVPDGVGYYHGSLTRVKRRAWLSWWNGLWLVGIGGLCGCVRRGLWPWALWDHRNDAGFDRLRWGTCFECVAVGVDTESVSYDARQITKDKWIGTDASFKFLHIKIFKLKTCFQIKKRVFFLVQNLISISIYITLKLFDILLLFICLFKKSINTINFLF